MKFLQHYYTSSKVGQGEGSGFQTYSLSEGLTELENQEIERNSIYIRPSHLIADPSEQELEMFPKAFSFYSLSSGRYGISLAQYQGTDYSGRTGNFFTHTLVCEKDNLYFHPIQLYKNNHLRNSLSVEEDEVIGRPEPLPELNLVAQTSFITKESIEKFLQENNRLSILAQMVKAVFLYKKNGRRILILDEQENIPLWLASISMAFPTKFAKEITFTTYTYDPMKSQYLLNATLPNGTNYQGNETMIGQQFYVFDLFYQEIPRIEEEISYPSFVMQFFHSDWSGLNHFFEFIENTKLEVIDDHLDNATLLYSFMHSGKISSFQLKQALQFAHLNCRDSYKKEIVKMIQKHYPKGAEELQVLILEQDIEIAESLSNLLFEVGNKTKEAETFAYAYAFFVSSFNQLIIDARDTMALEKAFAYYQKMKNLTLEVKSFSEIITEKHYLEEMYQVAKAEPQKEKLNVYLKFILEEMDTLGSYVDNLQSQYMFVVQLIDLALPHYQNIDNVELLLKKYPKYLGYALVVLYLKVPNYRGDLEPVLFNSIKKGDLPAELVLKWKDGRKLLDSLFKSLLEETFEPVTALVPLNEKLFCEEKPTIEQVKLVIHRLLEIKNTSSWMNQVETLFSSGYLVNFSSLSLVPLFDHAEKQLPLNENFIRYSSLVANIEKIKKSKIPLSKLYEFGESIKKTGGFSKQTLLKVADLLETTTDVQYKQYLKWIIPVLIKGNSFYIITEYLASSKRISSLWSVLEQIEQTLNKDEKIDLLTKFILAYLEKYEEQDDKLRKTLVEYFKSNKALWRKMSENAIESIESQPKIKNLWVEIESEVMGNNSLLKKLFTPFGRRK
ncbi:GAP1-N2 domain-containing protein [Niallia sp. FSL W8-1348]|uniref:GAP1-N2 domain-containing protein n=1 Tax=Niallia sp. FSL W8-1348 TaxID=2954656 RepID=UPI0030FAB070